MILPLQKQKEKIDKYFLLKVYKKDKKYLLIKILNLIFKNLTIFPMEELSKPKNNENLNLKVSNMNMNIKIQYLKNINKSFILLDNEKKLDNYMLPSFTKIVKY